MARIKYRYNPKTLSYDKVKPSFKYYGIRTFIALVVLSGVAIGSVAWHNAFFESSEVQELRAELKFKDKMLFQLKNEVDTLEALAQDLQRKDDDIYRSVFGADPYPSHLRQAGIGGVDRYKDLDGYESSQAIIETKKRLSKLKRGLVAQSKSLEEVFSLARNKKELLSSIPAIQPVSNKDLTRMASGYGYRIHPIYKIRKLHTGMDFTAPVGTEIYATGDGVVERVERKRTGYGHNVIIKHGFGYKTLYAHMSDIHVKVGQEVKRGEVIGLVGNTGTSVGPHLHYEVIKEGSKVNPANYYFNDLSPEQYEELLRQTEVANQSFD
ncbi:MAG: M23 family metallopeptidase [Flavobacteriales bacterium]|nr:M23 family metallopeptidase [Flavobacteriales bacterium]